MYAGYFTGADTGGNGGEERERGLVAMVAVLCRRFLAVTYI
ncbi:hypothetical protein [uncultured Megasphaera sp.]|nr:hypothetical protein [uncultured Megasphaera sp.]